MNKDITSTLMYISQYINLNFQKIFWKVNILYGSFFVKYVLINFRSSNQYTSIRISKQSKHMD